MSNPPNNTGAGLGLGLGLGGGANPALLNANAVLANLGQANGAGPGPAQTAGGMGLTPEQIRLLTEFHRQQAHGQAQGSPSIPQDRPPVVAPAPAPVRPTIPQHILRHIHNQEMSPADRSAFLARWMQTEEGRQVAAQHRQMQIAQAAQAQAMAQHQQGSPNLASAGLPRPPVPAADMRRGSSGSPQKPPGMAPSPSRLHPALSSSPAQSFASLPSGPDQAQAHFLQAGPRVHPPPPAAAGSSRPTSSSGPKGPFVTAPGPSQPPQPQQQQQQQQSRRPANSPEPPARPAPSRRREEGMRGTMRAELARLMYASGDVENPDLDSIDYMEDLVVDWLADLCAPPPPTRAHPSAPLTATRLDYDVIRHRLSRPSMRKYLDRFEYMEYKAIDMRSARRVARGNYEPVDQQDLDGQLEQGFLAGEGQQEGHGPSEPKKKRKYQFHTRLPTGGSTSTAATDKERKKPGPKKGWKAALTPEERERAKKARRARQSTTGSTGVKPEQQ